MDNKKKSKLFGGGYLKQIRIELFVAVMLIVVLIGSFYMAYAAAETGYHHDGWCKIRVGDATITVNVQHHNVTTGGTGWTVSDGDYRANFVSESRSIDVKSNIANGNAVTNLQIVDAANKWKTLQTKKDSSGTDYTTIVFVVSFTLKAHYYLKDTDKIGYISSGNGAIGTPHGYFKFISGNSYNNYSYNSDYDFVKWAGHSTSDRTFYIPVRLQLGNTSMIATSNKSNHDVATWFRSTLYVEAHRDKATNYFHDSLDHDETTSYDEGEEHTVPTHYTNGYTFNGWNEGNSFYSVGSKYTSCGTKHFYANYSARKHNVYFDPNGGAYPSDLKSQTTLNGCKIIPNGTYYLQTVMYTNRYVLVTNDYKEWQSDALVTYKGWNADNARWIFERYGNTQYYFITSKSNGLALELAGDPPNVADSKIELWRQGSKADDYLWYLQDEGNGKVAICNKASGKVLHIPSTNDTDTVLCQWYNNKGDSKQQFNLVSAEVKDYPNRMQYGNHNILINTVKPVKKDHTFIGWNTRSDGSGTYYYAGNTYTNIQDGDMILYAIYQGKTTINYDTNGGESKPALKSTTINTGEKLTLPDGSTLARTYYTFIGWSTDPHAKKNYEQPGAEVTISDSGEITYYAIWQSVHGNSNLANVITGDGMFTGDTELEGQNGTGYNSLHDGLDYAHPDEGVDNPGYYHEK